MNSIFITGVDTDIGKTFVSMGLCLVAEKKGLKTGYFKPFQSGGYYDNNELIAPDIAEIKKYSSNIETKYSYLFRGEVSPYLASTLNDVKIDIKKVKNDYYEFAIGLDFLAIEGAGGFYCPAYKKNLFSGVIKKLNQEIIVVTTCDLGRLNHTLMTLKCAEVEGIRVKGLIINKMPKVKTDSQKSFIDELKAFSDVKILGIIPKMENPSKEEIIEAFSYVDFLE